MLKILSLNIVHVYATNFKCLLRDSSHMIFTNKEGVDMGQMSVAQALKQSPGEF